MSRGTVAPGPRGGGAGPGSCEQRLLAALECLCPSQPGICPCIAGVACGPRQSLHPDLGHCFCSCPGCSWTREADRRESREQWEG